MAPAADCSTGLSTRRCRARPRDQRTSRSTAAHVHAGLRCSSPCPGTHAARPRCIAGAPSRAAPSAVVCGSRRPTSRRRCCPRSAIVQCRDLRAARRRARRSLLRRGPRADLACRRRHRHQRQDHHAPTCWRRRSDRVGRRGGTLGTLGRGRPGALRDAGLTTPDAVSVHRLLAEARDAGAQTRVPRGVVARARPGARRRRALRHGRVHQPHARPPRLPRRRSRPTAPPKARLFRTARPAARRDQRATTRFGRELVDRLDPAVERMRATRRRTTLGEPARGWIRRARAARYDRRPDAARREQLGAGTLRSRWSGEFNAENLLAVLGVLLGWGVPLQQALARARRPAPRRRAAWSAFGGGAQPLVLVDYAHSPDALGKALAALRAPTRAAGCCACSAAAATAIRGKRPHDGRDRRAPAPTWSIVTDDNPRTEEPRRSSSEILAGMRRRRTACTSSPTAPRRSASRSPRPAPATSC
ncbi:MAG: hypothetical protein MZV65_34520 [Chromatiales bacterium]|nr:hypothetical protein [Chromatiales bacterium]